MGHVGSGLTNTHSDQISICYISLNSCILGMINNWNTKHWCLFLKLAERTGAYIYEVICNECMYYSGSCMETNTLAVINKHFGPEVSLPANSCPKFVAFLEPEIQSATNRSLPPCPPTQFKIV